MGAEALVVAAADVVVILLADIVEEAIAKVVAAALAEVAGLVVVLTLKIDNARDSTGGPVTESLRAAPADEPLT